MYYCRILAIECNDLPRGGLSCLLFFANDVEYEFLFVNHIYF